MAKWQKKKIQETEGGKFGEYQESTGGGHPFNKGDSNTRTTRENGDLRQEENATTNQPRTDDGKFTYKSANGKGLKYPSRGKTVNPVLTGGENGVYIDDLYDDNGNLKKEGVVSQFSKHSGTYWNKYKDKWYEKGNEYVLMSQGKHHKVDWSTRVAGEAIWEIAKEYRTKKGEFKGESKVFEEGKKGRMGKEEQAAKQLAQATGEEQAVIDTSHGGLKFKSGAKPIAPKAAPQPVATTVQPSAGGIVTPQGGTQPTVNTASASDIVNADYQPKYSDEDIEDAKAALKEGGFTDEEIADFDALSPKEKDDYIDKYFEMGEAEETEEPVNAEPEEAEVEENEENEEEDSEAVKKVKKLGFTDED